MSSSSPRPELYRVVVHPAISVAVSITSVLSVILLVNQLTESAGTRLITVLAVVIAPLIEAGVGNLLYRERAGVGNRMRELIIYLILVYLVASLVKPGPFGLRFSPDAWQLVPALLAAIAWFHAFGIHNRLRGREGLLRRFHGVHGEELRHVLIERQHDMALTVRELRGVRGTILTGTAVVALLATATALFPFADISLPVRSGAFLVVVLQVLVSLWAVGLVNGFIDEYAANGIGLSVPYSVQRRRMFTVIPLAFVAVAAALILASENDLLPFERVIAFFRWFFSLFLRDREPAPPPPLLREAPDSPMNYELLREMLRQRDTEGPPLWLRMVAVLLRRLAVAIGVIAAGTLIFGPLFSSDFRAAAKRVHLWKSLKRLVRRLRTRVTILTRWIRARSRRRKDGAGIPLSADGTTVVQSAAGRGWKPSLLKRRQMDKAVAVFVEIAEWGRKHGVAYRASEGAREYLDRIMGIRPDRDEELTLCRKVFWAARYSQVFVKRKEMRAYILAARRITAAD